jgi:hypothetical protein
MPSCPYLIAIQHGSSLSIPHACICCIHMRESIHLLQSHARVHSLTHTSFVVSAMHVHAYWQTRLPLHAIVLLNLFSFLFAGSALTSLSRDVFLEQVGCMRACFSLFFPLLSCARACLFACICTHGAYLRRLAARQHAFKSCTDPRIRAVRTFVCSFTRFIRARISRACAIHLICRSCAHVLMHSRSYTLSSTAHLSCVRTLPIAKFSYFSLFNVLNRALTHD